MTIVVAAFVVVAVIGGLVLAQRHQNRRLAGERRRMIEPILAMLELPRVDERSGGYPVVSGSFVGRTVEIELHADAISVRKLPTLWLFVSAARSGRRDGVMSLMRRRRNTEYWSPFDDLAVAVPVPDGFPDDAVAAASDPGSAALVDSITGLAPWLRRDASKEVLVRPRSVRLCELVGEGQRGAYLIYRQSSFDGLHLDAGAVRATIAASVALAGHLDSLAPLPPVTAASVGSVEAKSTP